MMSYVAVSLCPSGGIVRDESTFEPAVHVLGDFDSIDEAVDQACATLNCTHLRNGVISKGEGERGYLVTSTQDLGAV